MFVALLFIAGRLFMMSTIYIEKASNANSVVMALRSALIFGFSYDVIQNESHFTRSTLYTHQLVKASTKGAMLIGSSRLLTIVCLFSLPTPSLCQESEHPQSVEARFRQTAQAWQSSGTYALWLSFAQALMLQFESSLLPPLEIVGGLEEGILAIERATQHEGENPPRDHALAELYYAYGKLLTLLDEQQCTDLALDPHTLLIGAETVQQSQPSTALCVQNAENSLRNAVTLNANHARAEELLQTLIGDNVVHQRQPKEFGK